MNKTEYKNPIKDKPVRQTGQSLREKRQVPLLVSMNNPLTSIRFSSLCLILACLSHAVGLFAQAVPDQDFIEAKPPVGVVKGTMRAGDRCGVLIAGGKTVYSNDTFSVTTRGHQVPWKVTGFTNNQPRFARLVSGSPSPYSTSPDCVPNFDKLVMLMESEAIVYKAASTKILRDQAMAATRKRADAWCKTNILCVAATLADISMVDDNTACLKLSNVNRGAFDNIRYPSVSLFGPRHINVPMTQEKAGSLKAGYRVIITGTPSFGFGDGNLMSDGLLQQNGFVCFRLLVLTQPSFVGAVFLDQVKYDVFDPKNETAK